MSEDARWEGRPFCTINARYRLRFLRRTEPTSNVPVSNEQRNCQNAACDIKPLLFTRKPHNTACLRLRGVRVWSCALIPRRENFQESRLNAAPGQADIRQRGVTTRLVGNDSDLPHPTGPPATKNLRKYVKTSVNANNT